MPRYIDADELKHELCIRQHMLNADSLWKTLEIMDAQPTADVVERKKGKWRHNGSEYKNRFLCSNCNYLWYFPAEEAHYCPNCGSQNEKEIKQ